MSGELVEADAELAAMYLECAERHRGLSDWAEGVIRGKAAATR